MGRPRVYPPETFKERQSEHIKRWLKANPERRREHVKKSNSTPKSRERRRLWAAAHGAEMRRTNRERVLVGGAKVRARRAGLPFNITKHDITIPEFCPVLGIPINLELSAGFLRNSPSLDRVVPELGYVRGNVRVISYRANSIKNNASAEEIRLVAEYTIRQTALLRWRGLIP